MCPQQDWHRNFTHQISFSLRKKKSTYSKMGRKHLQCTIQQSQEQNTNFSVNRKGRDRKRVSSHTVSVIIGGEEDMREIKWEEVECREKERRNGEQEAAKEKSEEGFCWCSSACGGVGQWEGLVERSKTQGCKIPSRILDGLSPVTFNYF